MKRFIVLLALVLSPVTFAQSPEDGKDAAYAQCARIPYDHDRNQCVKVVASAMFFNLDAVNACGKMNTFSDIVSCLVNVKDQWYQTSLVKTCERIPYLSDMRACLVVFAGNEADEAAVGVCNKSATYSEIVNCVKSVMRPYNPPAPIPTPPPAPHCDKERVMNEFDIGLKFLTEYKFMEAYQRFNETKAYLQGCL